MPRRLLWLIIVGGIGLSAISANATFLLYNTTTLKVYGGGDDPFTIYIPAGHDLFEVSGFLFSEIVWPVPTAPSSCATGRLVWTKFSPGPALPLMYNAEMKVFKCVPVANAAQIRAVAQRIVTEATEELKGKAPIDAIAFMALGQALCAVTTTAPGSGATCTSLRANNVTIGSHIGTLTDIVTWQNVLMSTFADANNAITGFGF